METKNAKNEKIGENESLQTSQNSFDDNLYHLYFLFNIDKNNYDKDQLLLEISKNDVETQFTELVKSKEKNSEDKKTKIIHNLYCISFIPTNVNEKNININLLLKINKENFISSNKITIINRKYNFLYEHSLEDIKTNHLNKTKLKIIQNKLDIYSKFIAFYMNLKPQKWENQTFSLCFIYDTLNIIKKKEPHFLIFLILLEISYRKSYIFYSILQEFYVNQKTVYFPKSLDPGKYRTFLEKISDEKNFFVPDNNKKDKNIENNKQEIILYIDALRENFYRKYDEENYLKLCKNERFLKVIKNQIVLNIITKNDNINFEIILDALSVTENTEEINSILKLNSGIFQILNYIEINYEHIESIFRDSKKKLNILSLIGIIEDENFKKIMEKHKLILEQENKNKFYFINFEKLIEKYMIFFSFRDLENLIYLREMIYNQKKFGEELNGMEFENNKIIHETGKSLALSGKLSEKEIINFICQTDKLDYQEKDLEIFKIINIYKFDEKDFQSFKINIWKKIYQKDLLLKIIINQISVMNDFGLIFKLVPDEIFNSDNIIMLEEKFQALFSTYKKEVCKNILEDICNLLLIYNKTVYSPSKFLQIIEFYLPALTSELYLFILKKKKIGLESNGVIKNHIIKFFTRQQSINDIESIIYILENINNLEDKSYINELFNNLEKYSLSVKDFFNKESNNKFKLYIHIYSFFTRNGKSLDNNYFNISQKELNSLYEILIQFKFKYSDALKLKEQFDDLFFKEKLKFVKRNNDIDNLFKSLKENIKKLEEYQKKLLKAKEFYKIFFELEEKEFLNEIDKKIKLLNEYDIIISINDLDSFFKLPKYTLFEKYYELQNSKFFMALFIDNKEKFKDKDEKTIFELTINSFALMNILNNWENDYPITKIPNYEIISKEIEIIINNNKLNDDYKENKKICKSLIQKELKAIKDIYIKKNENNIENLIKEERNEKEDEFSIFKSISNNNSQIIAEKNQENFSIEKNLIYLPFLLNLRKVLKSIKILIDLFNSKKTLFYIKISSKYEEINKNENEITLDEIKQKIKFLKTYEGIELNLASFKKNNENSVLIDFLKILPNNEEAIKFAFGKTDEEIRALSEFVGESENSKIQIRDIQDFMNVCNFLTQVKILGTGEKNTDFLLIGEFRNAFGTMPSFGTSFRNYLRNFREIKNVYEEYLDKPEVSRKKIEQILKNSKINLFLDTKRSIQIVGKYFDIMDNEKEFDNNDLQELHDRALLFSDKAFDNMVDGITDNFEEKEKNSKIFVEIVEKINILVNYLNSLYIKGYANEINITIKIKDSEAIDKYNPERNIQDIIEFYKKLTKQLEEAQTKAYKEKPLIRLIYGQQFYDIYTYLKRGNIDITPLLKKISDNQIMKYPKMNANMNLNQNFIQNHNFSIMINDINEFLKNCAFFNNITINNFFIKNIIKKEIREKINPGFFSWNVDEMNSEIQIISLYKNLTGNLPLPITLLFCNKETNEEEITSFIYRAVLCSFPVLFTIVNSDNLELSNAQYLLWILESLYEKNKNNICSTLLLVFNDIKSMLRKQVTLLNGHDYFIQEIVDINNNNDLKNDYNKNPIKVLTSDVAGVGKSAKIKNEAEEQKLNYVYFPIGGSITRKEIINRITELKFDKINFKNNFLHIDIYDSDKESSIIIREFLFCLLISRYYSYDDKTFYLEKEIKIIVEIPVGFYNMKDKFKLLNYFSQENLTINELPHLREIKTNNLQDNIVSDIQLVTNILKMLENNTIEDNVFYIDENHELIELNECENIINKFFTLPKGNYYQKMAFIHILADQFRKFCSSYYLNPEILIRNQHEKLLRLYGKPERFPEVEKLTVIRKIMIENLVKLTLYFVKGPYYKIVLNQKNTNLQLFSEYNEKKINEIANQSLSTKDEIISFEKINPSLVFFNEDIQTFSIITTSKKGDKEYNQLLKLYNSQEDIQNEKEYLIDYRNLSHENYLEQIKNILNLNTLSINKIKEIIGSYCFTSDNFIKMILILLRTRAGIPVIMMGETGCGKTSLIKILSSLLNKGNMDLKILNIHAGITDKDIIKFIEKVNKEANSDNNSNAKIWIFFDEINTCNSMGLLSEIFYKHTYYGKSLNKRLTFIAACNPYRLKTINENEKEKEDFCLNIADKNYYQSKQKLVYLVNPLPHSLLTSIFDFGSLCPEDEKKYIDIIVNETIKKYNINKDIEKSIVDQIILCQNFIRDKNDVSSVSLRDLRRFNILFDFFVDYLKKKNKTNDENEGNNNEIYIHSLCLCLYFCYIIRLSNKKLRNELETKIKIIFKGENYLDIIQKEKEFIISKVNIQPGIAKNSTLLENVFSLFVCIVNKIPLIICGKPGTSKSLSFQILYDSMKGDRSENDFFKKYPELLVFSYQGSKTSTSEGIQKAFNKARNCLKKNKEKFKMNNEKLNNMNLEQNKINNFFNYNNNNNKESKINIIDEVIPVLYFDEMGLAEESPNNPLKVIHSELEFDDNDLKIAFVGISNWRLDASKMNRSIFLGVPPLDEIDLENTAKEIASNLDKELSIKYKDLFSNLVKTYCQYKKEIKSSNQSEFHGLRDFYHLIKNAMNYLLNENKINENIDKSYEIGLKSLFRNFDGLKEPFNSFNKIKKIFDEFYKGNEKNNNSFNVFDCLEDNIKDRNSRYLLIIMESSMSIHLLSYIMKKLNKKYVFYSGSQLKEDINQQKYNEKLLNKIQLSLENGDILVLKNMENIYPSLYNLFNQNFTMLGGKKFARIAFANYKSYSLVNDNFRAIVLVDEEQIKEKMEDPPFLNRFEKHSFSFEYLMNEMELKITNKILKYMDLVLSFNKNKKCKLDLKKQILWYSNEEIKGIIFIFKHKYIKKKDKKINENENDLYNNILKWLSKLFSQDILVSIISINNDLKENKMPDDLLDYYRKNHFNNFKNLIASNIFNKEQNIKLIIYTFSKIYEHCIKGEEKIISDKFGILNQKNIREIMVDFIKNENHLESILEDYFNEEEQKILAFKFSEEDLNKMNQIKIKINQIETEKKNNEKYKKIVSNKHYIFLVFLTRKNLENQTNKKKNIKMEIKNIMINDLISNIDEEYNQFFIDNLHGKNNINIIDIISKSPKEYIKEIFNNKNNQLTKIFNQIFSYLTYEFKNENSEMQDFKNKTLNEENYIKEILFELSKNKYILDMIREKIETQFEDNLNEIVKNIFTHSTFEKSDIEFIDIIYKTIKEQVSFLLFKFIFKAEKDHFLSPFLFNFELIKKEKNVFTYIEKYIKGFDFLIIHVIERINSNQISLILNLLFPLSKKWYDKINAFIENNIKTEYIYNEEKLRFLDIEENKKIENALKNYSKLKNDFVNNIKMEIIKIEGLNDLIKTRNINYMKMIYSDFLTIYLSKKYKENISKGIKFLDILIQLRINIIKENQFAFIDNNKKKIILQDNFTNMKFYNKEKEKENNLNEEINIKYDEDTLCKIMLFLVSYSDEIYSLLEIFYSLNKYIDNFFNEWKEIIENKEVKYVINENNPFYTREVNESFFIIYESLIKCIFNNPDKYKSIGDDIFYEYLDSLQKLSKTAIQIYYKLYLPSKEVYTLQILVNIFSSYSSCKNKKNIYNIQEIFVNIIYNIIYENNFIENKIYTELVENYQSLQQLLDDLIDVENNEKEYSLLLNNLFLHRFNKSLDHIYRKKLSLTFFSNISNYQLNYILPILKKLINDVEPKNIGFEDLKENDCVNNFMNKFINVEKDNVELYKIINEKDNDILDLNILYYFECECNLFFRKLLKGIKINEINDKNEIIQCMNNSLLKISFKYLQKAISYYLGENNFDIIAKKIGKIYCIAYIKNYLKNFSKFITFNKNKNFLNYEEILNALLYKNNDRKIFFLKVFLFKCLFNNEKLNYMEFIESIKNKNDIRRILNHDDFGNLFKNNDNKHSYNYSFININTFDYYFKLNNLLDLSSDNFDNNKEFDSIINFIKNNNYKGIDLIYNILVNKFILDLYGKEKNNNELSTKGNIIFNKFNQKNINLHTNSLTIINFLLNKNLFFSKIIKKLKLKNDEITSEQLYILLLSIRIVILLQSFKNNIFSLFYINKNSKNELINFLNENYIPGAYPMQNEFVDSYYEISNHLNSQPSDNAIYMCSCGKYYNIKPCGFPVLVSRCQKCNSEIGGFNHALLRRKNHYRIFLNEKDKDKEFKKFFADRTMPYKYLDQFKREIIDPILNTPNKGIGKMTKEIINKTGTNIRNKNELTIRILNFVLFSHILVDYILDILNNNDISKYISEECSCFGIIIDNWGKIKEILFRKGINNIEIFMNIIIYKIIEIIGNSVMNNINTYEGRDTIENNINEFINENNNISNCIKLYENQNEQLLNSSPESISSMIQDLYPRNFYNGENKYSYYKYFYYYNYPNNSSLYNIIESNENYKNKYPLTYNILKYDVENKKEIELLKYLPKVNKKLNYLIQNYSYKISREDALKRTIKDEYNKNENNLFVINTNKKIKNVEEYINDIKNLFDNFKNTELQWGCHKLQNINLKSNSSLGTILLDDSEPGYYLSSIFKKLIEYQNLFLDNIINSNSQNGLLYCFVKQLNNEIMVQDANFNEIVRLDFKENNQNNIKLYSSLDELIFLNTINDTTINQFNYELDQIEIELGNIILPGLRKFKSSNDELRFITYMYEGYRGKNSNILTNFNEKYPPQELNHEEKEILNRFIQNNENEDYKTFLFSIQLLIDYIQKFSKKEKMISEIIKEMPEYININENVKYFFRNNNKFIVNKLVRIYELFEYLCWDQIKDNLLDEFMNKIKEDKLKVIDEYFKNNNNKNNFIKKNELAGAVRKFISRYLAGKRSQSDINEDKMLFDYLYRVDLWTKDIENDIFIKELSELSKLKINVGEGLDFYDYLGGDSQLINLNHEEKVNNKEKNEDEYINLDNRNRIILNEDEEEEELINTNRNNIENNEEENEDEDFNPQTIQRRRLF